MQRAGIHRASGLGGPIVVAWLAVAALGAVAAPRPAQAQAAPSSAGAHFLKNMAANFRDVDPADPLCQGTFGVGDMAAAERLHETIERSYSFANMAAGRVPAADRSHPEVAAALQKLEGLRACHTAIGKRLKSLQAEAAQAEGRYDAFLREGQPYRNTVERLLMFAEDLGNKDMYTPNVEELTRWRDHLRAIHALCTGKYQGVTNPARGPHGRERDVVVWCKLGANADAIGKALAVNYLRSMTKLALDAFQTTLRDFESREGYLVLQGEIIEQAFFEPAAFKAEMNKRAGPLLQAAGADVAGDAWGEFDELHKALWAKIDAAAPGWKRPPSAGGGAAAAAAKATFGKFGKGVSVIGAWLTRSEWQIHKNPLGIPLRRTQPGYAVYKTPADKTWCRGRSWTYTEQYTGKGYAKASEVVVLGYIRFESCR